MAVYVLDSSALVKRYVREIGSAWVSGLFDPSLNNDVLIAAITGVEIVAAITRRACGGSITMADATTVINQFRNDLHTDYQIVEITDRVINSAMVLAETHGLRGYDAVQLAAALEVNTICLANSLPSVYFVSADGELNAAAVSEGLNVQNPNNYP
jgi:hypothetical protein